jgi:hypothetical protein
VGEVIDEAAKAEKAALRKKERKKVEEDEKERKRKKEPKKVRSVQTSLNGIQPQWRLIQGQEGGCTLVFVGFRV